jgi:hypothetical protein
LRIRVLVLLTWNDSVRLHSANKAAEALIGQVRYLVERCGSSSRLLLREHDSLIFSKRYSVLWHAF